ncbi:MAG: cation:proton antiporter [Sciscionella sp.]
MILLVGAAVCLAAVISNKLTAILPVPAPGLMFVAAAIAAWLVPGLGHVLSTQNVTRLVTVALVFILFDGGMHIGWSRFRAAAMPVLSLGVLGTFVTAGLAMLVMHYVLSFSWAVAAVVATAVSPTDPAVVFSVLGKRDVVGRTATILEGEAGANDPVGIALMVGVLAFVGGSGSTWAIPETFGLQMAVGTALGAVGGWGLVRLMRLLPLPYEGLYPLRAAMGAVLIYGAAAVLGGSGFMAVLVAGILAGDERAPYKHEIGRFHSSLAAMAEIVIFIVLGLTVDVPVLAQPRVWVSGLVLAVLLAVVVRPIAVGPLLTLVRLRMGERLFVVWCGLKGAVPILLGAFALLAGTDASQVGYGIIIVVVAFSMLIQALTIPAAARALAVPMCLVTPQPWDISVRLTEEPRGVLRYRVAAGSAADGVAAQCLPLSEGAWIGVIVRGGQVVRPRPECTILADDDVLILGEDERTRDLDDLFCGPVGPDLVAPPGTTAPRRCMWPMTRLARRVRPKPQSPPQ